MRLRIMRVSANAIPPGSHSRVVETRGRLTAAVKKNPQFMVHDLLLQITTVRLEMIATLVSCLYYAGFAVM